MGDAGTLTMKSLKPKTTRKYVDDYENLLNTIEQEHSVHGVDIAATENMDLKSRRESDTNTMPSVMTMDLARNSKTMDKANTNQTIDRHDEEPIIDFELEQEMIDLDKANNM